MMVSHVVAKALIVSAIIFLFPGEVNAASHAIYYVETTADTFIPITQKSIEQYYSRFSDVSKGVDIETLKELVSRSPKGRFDQNRVRAKIVSPNSDVLYIDSLGGIKIGSREMKFSYADFIQARSILNRLTVERK